MLNYLPDERQVDQSYDRGEHGAKDRKKEQRLPAIDVGETTWEKNKKSNLIHRSVGKPSLLLLKHLNKDIQEPEQDMVINP